MAILPGTAASGDILVSEILRSEILLQLADRSTLINHPTIVRAPKANMSGSLTQKMPRLGFFKDEMAAVAENTAVAATALASDTVTVSVARHAITREYSDLLRSVDITGAVDPRRLAEDAVQAGMNSAMTDLMGLGTSIADSTNTGAAASVASWMVAKSLLNGLASAGAAQVMAQEPWGEFQADLASFGGAIAFDPATRDLLNIKGLNYVGTFQGVDFYVSNRVDTDAGDHVNILMGSEWAIYKDADIPPSPGLAAQNAVFAGPISIEYSRPATEGGEVLHAQYQYGVALNDEPGRAVQYRSLIS